MNHILLYLLMSGLQESHYGRPVRDILWLDPILVIRFQGRDARCIVAILSNPGPFCYLSIDDPALGRSARPVFEDTCGGTLAGLSVSNTDCILRLDFSKRGEALALSLFLYGNNGRAALTRDNAPVVSLGGGGGGTAGGRNVLPPLVDIAEDDLNRFLEPDTAMDARIPGLEAGMIEAFSRPDGRCDVEKLLQFRNGLLKGSRDFYLAARKGLRKAYPIPAPAAHSEEEGEAMGPFSNATAAGRYIGEQLLEKTCGMILDRRLRPFRKRIEAKRRLRTRLGEDLQEAESFGRLRRETEALAAYQTRVPAGAASIQLPDLYREGETLTIELEPSLPLNKQIQKRFQKAAKLERSVGKIAARLGRIEKDIRFLEDVVQSTKAARSFADAVDHVERGLRDPGVPRPGGRSRAGTEKGKTYRRFDIDKNWFVLVGRSNRENDFITFHLASPNDWWFHAQSVPGSHVVLKSKGTGENPPDRILRAAAGIAAYYSKSRHASLVPVIYTRRKYVRKPRKAGPGKVTCEREKTLFTEPVLPQTHPTQTDP